jgi:hypothetical protein
LNRLSSLLLLLKITALLYQAIFTKGGVVVESQISLTLKYIGVGEGIDLQVLISWSL